MERRVKKVSIYKVKRKDMGGKGCKYFKNFIVKLKQRFQTLINI
jgi:hypothetical protein